MKRYSCLIGLALLALAATAHARTVEVEVNGLVCAFCAQGIEKTLRAFPATDDVFVSLEHRLVAVSLKDGQTIDEAELERAITDAGYTAVAIDYTDTPLDAVRERVKREDDE